MISFRKNANKGLVINTMIKHKYKRSRQREEILNILRNTDTHPTASWIYDELKKEFNNLSMGTVYRNVNILIDQNLVTKIESGSSFDRFDGKVEPHYHFICQECDSVYDMPVPVIDELNVQANSSSSHEIKEHRINFYGTCESCISNGLVS